jgi:hypothetical protein
MTLACAYPLSVGKGVAVDFSIVFEKASSACILQVIHSWQSSGLQLAASVGRKQMRHKTAVGTRTTYRSRLKRMSSAEVL